MRPLLRKLPRRTLFSGFAGLGAGLLLRPLLEAEGQSAGPKRLVIIHRPCGTHPDRWFPKGGVRDWQTTPLLSSFESLRQDMVVFSGIDLPRDEGWRGDKHGAGMVTAMAPAPADGFRVIPGSDPEEVQDADGKFFSASDTSIDQELQQTVPALQGTPIASLQLGASRQSMRGSGPECLRALSYTGFAQPLWPESRANVAFDAIFGGALVGSGDPALLEQARARRKSVLDFVTADMARLQARAPSSQLPKLEAHLQGIRALEQQLSSAGAGCQVPTLPDLPVPNTPALDQGDIYAFQHAEVARQQLELLHSALACDLTRVATFTFGYGNSEESRFDDLFVRSGHHTLSHDALGPVHEQVDKFYGDLTAKFLLDLKNTPEGGGNMLDNTLVVYFSECTIGNQHSLENNPLALFGGKQLGLQGGSFLSYQDRTFADLWVETFRRFGVNKASYGADRWNNGPLAGLYA